MRKFKVIAMALAIVMIFGTASCFACSAVYIGSEVSTDGTMIIARSEDQSCGDYNKMSLVVPRQTKANRTMEDTGNGFSVPLPKTTYKYTALKDYEGGEDGPYWACCSNEYGVNIIGTVTAYGCEEWEAIDPYIECSLRESIIPGLIACQVKTAKGGVNKLAALIDKYGSEEGNVIFIADQKEAWIFEIYGGHEYCAMKLSQDQVAVFGNQYMIGCVDKDDTTNFVFSKDLFTKLDQMGAVMEDGKYNIIKTITKETRDDLDASANLRTWMGQKLLAPSQSKDYVPDYFYDLQFTPDEKVSVLDVMDIFRNRYEGTEFANNSANYYIGNERQSDTHILQIFKDNPKSMSAVLWLALGDSEHSVFIPAFSGINQTYKAYRVDGDTYDPSSMFWSFKRICNVAAQDRELLSQGVKDYYNLEEERMYSEIMAANKTMNKLYKESPKKARTYVTTLATNMAKVEKANTNKLFRDLFTLSMHNSGIRYEDPVNFVADTKLRVNAEFKGYTVTKAKNGKTVTLKKGTDKIVLTMDSDVAKVTKDGVTEKVTMSGCLYTENGFMYVPVDFINSLE